MYKGKLRYVEIKEYIIKKSLFPMRCQSRPKQTKYNATVSPTHNPLYIIPYYFFLQTIFLFHPSIYIKPIFYFPNIQLMLSFLFIFNINIILFYLTIHSLFTNHERIKFSYCIKHVHLL